MKATVTLRDLDVLSGALLRLGEKELPIKLAFRVTRLMQALEPGIQAYQQARQELINRFAVRKHNQLIIETPNIPFYNAELTALNSTEMEIDFEPVALDDLVDSGITITAVDLKALDMLLFTGKKAERKEDDA